MRKSWISAFGLAFLVMLLAVLMLITPMSASAATIEKPGVTVLDENETPSEPTEPSEPTVPPTEPTQPQQPTDPSEPSGSQQGQQTSGAMKPWMLIAAASLCLALGLAVGLLIGRKFSF